jgi:hypothetical protein
MLLTKDNYYESELDYETTYGHCLAQNPYWFIPDVECNTGEELLSWRHAVQAEMQGKFVCPEHYFTKTLDTMPTKLEALCILAACNGVVSMTRLEDGQVVLHGHTPPWGMGISALSDKVDVWDAHPDDRWLIDLAESSVSDEEFLAKIGVSG